MERHVAVWGRRIKGGAAAPCLGAFLAACLWALPLVLPGPAAAAPSLAAAEIGAEMLRQGRYAEAVSTYRRAVEEQPEAAEAIGASGTKRPAATTWISTENSKSRRKASPLSRTRC